MRLINRVQHIVAVVVVANEELASLKDEKFSCGPEHHVGALQCDILWSVYAIVKLVYALGLNGQWLWLPNPIYLRG